jgi:hypothetical protein
MAVNTAACFCPSGGSDRHLAAPRPRSGRESPPWATATSCTPWSRGRISADHRHRAERWGTMRIEPMLPPRLKQPPGSSHRRWPHRRLQAASFSIPLAKGGVKSKCRRTSQSSCVRGALWWRGDQRASRDDDNDFGAASRGVMEETRRCGKSRRALECGDRLEQLRGALRESLPLDEERRAEARVWLAFFGRSLAHPELARDR